MQYLTDQGKIDIIKHSLKSMAFGDIRNASDGGAKMGAFILCSCLIDAVAGFMKGKDTDSDDYRAFVRKYLVNYDPQKLYRDLRCKVVHSYSEGGTYYFTDNNRHLHLSKSGRKVLINLENFMEEIEAVLDAYLKKLDDPKNVDLRAKAIKRHDKNGVISVGTVTGGVLLSTVSASGTCM